MLILRPGRGENNAHKRNNCRDKQMYTRIETNKRILFAGNCVVLLIESHISFTRMIHGYRQSM